MKITIDRIEGHYAVVELESGTIANLPIIFVPPEAKEGDIIQIEINRLTAEDKRKQVKDLIDKVFED